MEKHIKLISSDLNGTLVHQHTMMDMIRLGFPHEPERYEKAREAFIRQTSGLLSMEDTFEIAGPLTKGLSLRSAIEYTRKEMRLVEGFEEFLSILHQKGIYFVMNSTGYSVTIHAIRLLYGEEKFHHHTICNRLLFASKRKPNEIVSENDLYALVKDYFLGHESDEVYDEILATGQVKLGIQDEKDKARLIFDMAENMRISRNSIVHIGDTMGDSQGITEVVKNGGIGIAFNYNPALERYLGKVLDNEDIPGAIFLVDAKSENSDLRRVSEILGLKEKRRTRQ